MPFIGAALIMAAMAGCGLPGFANFAGEASVFFGAWSQPALRVIMVFAVWGALVIGAVYMLRAVRAVLHGPVADKWSGVVDAKNPWRKLPFALLLAALLVFGFVPSLLTNKITPDAEKIVKMVNAKAATVNTAAVGNATEGTR